MPYRVIDLEKKLKDNKKYKSLQDVIKNEYTLPLETFKNPTKSRFREAFQLIKKKEHGSLKEAILDCLDDNELDKFSCFNIEYNVPPTKSKKRK